MKKQRGNFLIVFGLLILLAMLGVYFFRYQAATQKVAVKIGQNKKKPKTKLPFAWPPQVGKTYPNLKLIDQTGATVELASFKGKIIIVEPIGMDCPGCQGFAGANKLGAYGNVRPQKNLISLEEMLPLYAKGTAIDDKRIVYVQLLLYNLKRTGAPVAEDAKKWAKHFKMDRSKNKIVLVGTIDFIGPASFKMIPGFQLIDKDFILRSDSTGHHPQHNLYKHLLPMVPKLLAKVQ